MDTVQIVTLAIIQGLTEFLPISSSAHLILVPVVFGWRDQGLAFDVATHVGTLAAVVYYFRRDLLNMARDWCLSLARRQNVGESRLAWAIVLGTIPVGVAGLLLNHTVETSLRSTLIIAATTIGFGLLMWGADLMGKQERDEHTLSWRDVLLIGCAQALALIPGTSRSGITMTAGLLLGLTRSASARFSFLLSIPVIVLAGGLETAKLIRLTTEVDWWSLFLGTVLSAISAYLCIKLFLSLFGRIGMLPFTVYRLLMGIILLMVFW